MSKKDFTDVLVEKWQPLLAVVGICLVLVAARGIYLDIQSRREREATNMLYEAQTAARAMVSAKTYDQAEKAYQPLLEKFPSSRASYEAELQIGDFWMDANQVDKALVHYNQALKIAADPFSRLLVHYTLGAAYESLGKFAEAIKEYEAVEGLGGSDFIKPEILMAEARCYESLKESKRAIELYKTVQDKFPNRSYYSGAAAAFEKQLSAKQM